LTAGFIGSFSFLDKVHILEQNKGLKGRRLPADGHMRNAMAVSRFSRAIGISLVGLVGSVIGPPGDLSKPVFRVGQFPIGYEFRTN